MRKVAVWAPPLGTGAKKAPQPSLRGSVLWRGLFGVYKSVLIRPLVESLRSKREDPFEELASAIDHRVAFVDSPALLIIDAIHEMKRLL